MDAQHEKRAADRRAKLARIRREIEDGTYETPAKLEAALDAFLQREVGRPRKRYTARDYGASDSLN